MQASMTFSFLLFLTVASENLLNWTYDMSVDESIEAMSSTLWDEELELSKPELDQLAKLAEVHVTWAWPPDHPNWNLIDRQLKSMTPFVRMFTRESGKNRLAMIAYVASLHQRRGNMDEAFALYSKGSYLGNVESYMELGYMYLKGQGTLQSGEMAFYWMEKAALSEIDPNAKAMWQYGVIHDPSVRISKESNWNSWNHLVEESYELAEYWYRKATNTPNCDGTYGKNHQAENSLSFLLVTLGRYSEAAITYQILADKDFIPAQLQMARLYRDGLGVTKSHKMSAKWFRKAANLGSSIGQYKMGMMYSHQTAHKSPLSYDIKKSRKWYRKAAEQNHLSAIYILAQSYQVRPGRLAADTNEFKSMKWFQKAAMLGDTGAMYEVGSIYYRGATPKFSSFKKAMEWFHKATTPNQDTLHPYGNADAIYWLGVMNFYGEGIEAMPFAANIYWMLASLQNHKKAENALLTNGDSVRETSVLGNVCVTAGCDENGEPCILSRLYCACQKNDTEEVDRLLLNPRENADANKQETMCNLAKDLSTPLLVASFRGYTSMVIRLLSENNIILSLNLQESKDGMTPLLAACQQGHTQIVKLLLGVKGIDVNLPNALDGASGLYFACQNGYVDIVKLLLDVKGIDVNLPRFDYGTTPMAIAAQKGHMNIVYLLLAMDGISMDGFSPLGRKKKNKKNKKKKKKKKKNKKKNKKKENK